jgi:hypothetical protein
MLKHGTDKLIRMLTRVINICLNGEEVPQQWKVAYISSIHKKGSKKDCSIYRGISVKSVISRLYGKTVRMAEERLPRIALSWIPKQKRARGRTKKNWMEGIRKAMNERILQEGQWEDRKQWNLGVRQGGRKF